MPAQQKKTKYPGVQRIGECRYRIRAEIVSPKTGKKLEIDRRIEAASAAEAAHLRSSLIEQVKASAPADRVRVGDFASSWLNSKLPDLGPSTRHKYSTILENHVLPAIGEYWIDAVGFDDVVRLRDQWAASAAPSTVNTRLNVLRTVFSDAYVQLRLPRNPTTGVHNVRETGRKARRSLTAEQLGRLLAAAKVVVPQWYPLLLAVAHTGLRFSEAAALQWGDVDFDAGTISVNRRVWRGHVGPLKTPGSYRVVPMSAELRATLAKRRPGDNPTDVSYIFTSRAGTLYNSGALTKPLRAAATAAGLGRTVSSHDFRHTVNNLARQAGGGDVARAITGHVTEQMTRHYSHVEIEERRAALDAALSGAGVLHASDNGTTHQQSETSEGSLVH